MTGAGTRAPAGSPGGAPVEAADAPPEAPPLSVARFTAMGCAGRIVTAGGPADLADRASAEVSRLERLWSRFLPGSEISQLNRRPGQVTVVSEPTFDLISKAVLACEATRGRFNPLLLTQLEALGYDRPWDGGLPPAGEASPEPATTEPIELYPVISAVRLPAGCRFDPGGLGKGLAVDRITAWCLARGATTVCVDLGGDLRVAGQPWYGPAWRIGVEHPFDPAREIGSFTPTAGAVTTSTILYRVWDGPEGRRHHLLDPATGCPARTDLVSVTTCSSEAWWAEAAAKAVLLSGSAAAVGLLRRLGTPGLAVAADGRVITSDAGTSDAGTGDTGSGTGSSTAGHDRTAA